MSSLYLITGFLGAGKTTFLKQFMKQFSSERMHIIVNEFGKEGIDGELLSELGIALDEINNGSIFCSCRLDKFKNVLQHTKSLDEVSEFQFDCVYLAGGHGSMYDFPDNIVLQAILKKQYENEKKVAAICHGVCGLLNVTLASGEYLVKDKKLTGFSRAEEILARKERVVPFDLETELKDRGARYEKALIPMTSKVVIDGNLFTGENPFSSKKMAEVILQCFSKK